MCRSRAANDEADIILLQSRLDYGNVLQINQLQLAKYSQFTGLSGKSAVKNV